MRSFSPLFAVIFALFTLTLAAPSLSADAAPEAVAPEAVLDLPVTGSSSALCPALAPAVAKAVPVAAASQCDAVADCEDNTTRSCSDTTDPAECTAVDQDCANNVRGYVQCDDDPKDYCPICEEEEEEDCTFVQQCNPCGNAPPKCGCVCVQGACGRIDAWVCL